MYLQSDMELGWLGNVRQRHVPEYSKVHAMRICILS